MKLSKNNVVLIGEVKSIGSSVTKDNINVCRVEVETIEETEWKGKKNTRSETHNVVAWDKLANQVLKTIKVGDTLYTEGRLQTRVVNKSTPDVKVYEVFSKKLANLSLKAQGLHNDPSSEETHIGQTEEVINKFSDIPF